MLHLIRFSLIRDVRMIIWSIGILLLTAPILSHQADCGQKLASGITGKGVVVCSVGIHGNVGNVDYGLCTHISLVVDVKCENETCYPVDDANFEEVSGWVQPHVSTKMGLEVTVDVVMGNYLSSHLRRQNTITKFLEFMEEKNITYIILHEFRIEKDVEDRNSLWFIQEVSGPLHERNWHIGLKVDVQANNFYPAYNFSEMSKYVDWFTFSTRKRIIAGQALQPLAPLSASQNEDGTTRYWIEKALQWLKPECVVLIVDIFGVKYIANETSAEPGPGSKVHISKKGQISIEAITLTQLCYRLLQDPTCQEHWDSDSSTPWAACGMNEFFTYEDHRSVSAKTNLARQYNLAGMSIYLDRKDVCEDKNPFLLVKALQDIRQNVTT